MFAVGAPSRRAEWGHDQCLQWGLHHGAQRRHHLEEPPKFLEGVRDLLTRPDGVFCAADTRMRPFRAFLQLGSCMQGACVACMQGSCVACMHGTCIACMQGA
eukprot:361622-Chlamydomonas_euryale.AAC.4